MPAVPGMSSQADDEVPLTQEEQQTAEIAGLSPEELRSSFGASEESPVNGASPVNGGAQQALSSQQDLAPRVHSGVTAVVIESSRYFLHADQLRDLHRESVPRSYESVRRIG